MALLSWHNNEKEEEREECRDDTFCMTVGAARQVRQHKHTNKTFTEGIFKKKSPNESGRYGDRRGGRASKSSPYFTRHPSVFLFLFPHVVTLSQTAILHVYEL